MNAASITQQILNGRGTAIRIAAALNISHTQISRIGGLVERFSRFFGALAQVNPAGARMMLDHLEQMTHPKTVGTYRPARFLDAAHNLTRLEVERAGVRAKLAAAREVLATLKESVIDPLTFLLGQDELERAALMGGAA